jgi:hypothetical protein
MLGTLFEASVTDPSRAGILLNSIELLNISELITD